MFLVKHFVQTENIESEQLETRDFEGKEFIHLLKNRLCRTNKMYGNTR